jgi:tRNA/tmRNA/rRNA uracil-C5-methylase (TrmA/RlmC/RlmD family)
MREVRFGDVLAVINGTSIDLFCGSGLVPIMSSTCEVRHGGALGFARYEGTLG